MRAGLLRIITVIFVIVSEWEKNRVGSICHGGSSAAEAIGVSRYRGNWLGGFSQEGCTRELHYIDPSVLPTPEAYTLLGWLLNSRYQFGEPVMTAARGAVDTDEPGEGALR